MELACLLAPLVFRTIIMPSIKPSNARKKAR
jgi:hypothetical protein